MTRSIFALLATALVGVSPLSAQQKRISPHETISQTFDGKRDNRVMIVYGRPYSKNPKTGEIRQIWGSLNPWGQVWRMGSDEAALLIARKPLKMGGATIPAGAYTLFMIPYEDGTAKLIVNRQIGQWGLEYDQKQDFARIDLKRASVDPRVDQFTMALSRNPEGGGILKMTWENAEYSVPFAIVKE